MNRYDDRKASQDNNLDHLIPKELVDRQKQTLSQAQGEISAHVPPNH